MMVEEQKKKKTFAERINTSVPSAPKRLKTAITEGVKTPITEIQWHQGQSHLVCLRW